MFRAPNDYETNYPDRAYWDLPPILSGWPRGRRRIAKGFLFLALAEGAAAAPTPFDNLMRMLDAIDQSDPQVLAGALPVLFTAVAGNNNNLAVEALSVVSVIARRSDGPAMLRSRLPQIGALLNRDDERLRGGAVLVFELTVSSAPGVALPIMVQYLNGPAKPNTATASLFFMLLKFSRADPKVLPSIEPFLRVDAEPDIRAATLQALGANHVTSLAIDAYVLRALGDPDKFVKVAAIYASHSISPGVWDLAKPIVSKLALDPSVDPEVKLAADRMLAAGYGLAPPND